MTMNDDLDAYDKFDRLLSLIGVLDMMAGATILDNRAIGELAWTMRERFEDALATLIAERLEASGVSAKAG